MLGIDTLRALPYTWREREKVLAAFFEIGNASLLMSCILSMFIGGVLALQSGPVLVQRAWPRHDGHTHCRTSGIGHDS